MENNQQVIVSQEPTFPVETPPPPIIPPAKKSNKKLLIILGIVLILILLSVVLFFTMGKKMTSVVAPSPTPIPTTTQKPTPTVSPTSANPVIELTLVKGKATAIPNSDITIVYKGQSAPNPKCVDCSTKTDIVLTRLKNDQKLSYVCGGIAGTCTEKLSGFGYDVSLGKITDVSAVVKIQKQ